MLDMLDCGCCMAVSHSSHAIAFIAAADAGQSTSADAGHLVCREEGHHHDEDFIATRDKKS
jgi:hypothetical protein